MESAIEFLIVRDVTSDALVGVVTRGGSLAVLGGERVGLSVGGVATLALADGGTLRGRPTPPEDRIGPASASPEFVKHDAGKARPALLPPRALLAVSRVLAFGAAKYSADNWRAGGTAAIPRYLDAAQRHVLEHLSGRETDPESGEASLAHAVASLLFAIELAIVAREA